MIYDNKSMMHPSPIRGEVTDFSSSSWLAQPKWNGQRVLVKWHSAEPDTLRVTKRSGRTSLIYPGPTTFPVSSVVMDGEKVGYKFVVFDLLEMGGVDVRAMPIEKRLTSLREVVENLNSSHASFSLTPTESPDLILRLVDKYNIEGVVFKRRCSPYIAGRSHHWQKFVRKSEALLVFSLDGFRPHSRKREAESISVATDFYNYQLANAQVADEQWVPVTGRFDEIEQFIAPGRFGVGRFRYSGMSPKGRYRFATLVEIDAELTMHLQAGHNAHFKINTFGLPKEVMEEIDNDKPNQTSLVY